jgi:peptidoglycan/xylan/chitin deacetylase (PgdA/CDA1 family)
MITMSLPGVPVFVYHGDRDMPGSTSLRERKYWISGMELREQCAFLRDMRYRAVSLTQLWAAESSGTDSVVITFDDGVRSDYEVAYPIFSEYGIRGHFFVNTSTVGSKGYVTWAELREMQRGGMSIQSHAHDHVYLARMGTDAIRAQLARSRALLEDRLGEAVQFLAAPYGDYDQRVVALAKETGYKALCTSRSLPARVTRGLIDRTVVYGGMRKSEFGALLRRAPSAFGARLVVAGLKAVPKRIWLGMRPAETTSVARAG